MKKGLHAFVAVSLAGLLMAGCTGKASMPAESKAETGEVEKSSENQTAIAKEDMKVGIFFIGDENEGYSASHMNGILTAAEELGLSEDQIVMKMNISEDETALDAAEDLVSEGCQLVIGTSFGHESYLMESAASHPDLTFCHATGYQAAASGLSNFHNYFDDIYEARYVSGVVAGMKLKEMVDAGKITAEQCKMGYVGAYPYAEVISGFTSFYLGAKSIVPEVTMKVLYTNSWGDPAAEAETAKQLISDGCVLISQHADTTGAPTACEEEKVPCVGYNVDMTGVAPNTALTSPTNNWAVYYKYAMESVMNGTPIQDDWSEGFSQDAVRITALGSSVAAGTEEKVKEAEEAIRSGALHVFDTKTFTVNGEELKTCEKNGTEYVADGYFHESEFASAPAFDLIVDGIESVVAN